MSPDDYLRGKGEKYFSRKIFFPSPRWFIDRKRKKFLPMIIFGERGKIFFPSRWFIDRKSVNKSGTG